jgi:hypothetical protein
VPPFFSSAISATSSPTFGVSSRMNTLPSVGSMPAPLSGRSITGGAAIPASPPPGLLKPAAPLPLAPPLPAVAEPAPAELPGRARPLGLSEAQETSTRQLTRRLDTTETLFVFMQLFAKAVPEGSEHKRALYPGGAWTGNWLS